MSTADDRDADIKAARLFARDLRRLATRAKLREDDRFNARHAGDLARQAAYEAAASILERAEDEAATAALAVYRAPEKRPAARAPLRAHAWRANLAVAPKRTRGVQ